MKIIIQTVFNDCSLCIIEMNDSNYTKDGSWRNLEYFVIIRNLCFLESSIVLFESRLESVVNLYYKKSKAVTEKVMKYNQYAKKGKKVESYQIVS